MPIPSLRRFAAASGAAMKRPRSEPKKRSSFASRAEAWAWPCEASSLSASHGVTVNAMASESSIPMLALMGMGLM